MKSDTFDTLREAMDFAQGKRPIRFFSGYDIPEGGNYRKIESVDAAQLAEDYPDSQFIGSRPVGTRPGEVVIQPRIQRGEYGNIVGEALFEASRVAEVDPDDDCFGYLRRD